MSSNFDYYYIVEFFLVIFFFRWLSVIWQKWEFLPQFELLCPRRLRGWLPPLSWTVGWDIPGTHSQIFLIWWPQPAPHFRKHFYGTSPPETRPVDIPHPSAYFSAWAGRQSVGTSARGSIGKLSQKKWISECLRYGAPTQSSVAGTPLISTGLGWACLWKFFSFISYYYW